jgi:hypothetical protein
VALGLAALVVVLVGYLAITRVDVQSDAGLVAPDEPPETRPAGVVVPEGA